MQKNSNFKIKTEKALAKLTIEQLNEELKAAKDQLVLTRENLAAKPDDTELQQLVEDLDIYSATISDMLSYKGSVKMEEENKEEPAEEPATVKDGEYKVDEKLANYIHVEVRKGNKFDPETGKPVGVTYNKCYTYKQFMQFKRNASLLGYRYKILYVPAELKGKIN